MPATNTTSLPTNAYEVLEPGETYPPIISASSKVPELTARSFARGVALRCRLHHRVGFSGLKVGQVMESAIAVSILAVGLARVYSRQSSVLENVIITGIGGVAGSVSVVELRAT